MLTRTAMKTICLALLIATSQVGCTAIGWAVDATIDEIQEREVTPQRAEAEIEDGEDVEITLRNGGESVEGRFGGVSHDYSSFVLVDDERSVRARVPIENVDLIYAQPHESGLDPYAGAAIGLLFDLVAIGAAIIVLNDIDNLTSGPNIVWQ